jgi:hypothetical protein
VRRKLGGRVRERERWKRGFVWGWGVGGRGRREEMKEGERENVGG